MSQEWAPRNAKIVWEQHGKAGQTFRRFVCSSFWRTFSAPPQDWPLALCDGNSISQDDGARNRLIFAEARPAAAQMTGPIPDEDALPAATIFHYSADQRWFYFPDMNRDEIVLLKFHDSDHNRAWFTAHTAFHDANRAGAVTRESIEFRTFAFWL